MIDPRTARLAQVMVNYCIEVQPRQRIALYGSTEAEPMLRVLYREVLQAGGYPYPFLGYEVYPSYGGFDDIFFKEASEDQLKHVFETDKMVRSSFDGMIILRSSRNTRYPFQSRADPSISIRHSLGHDHGHDRWGTNICGWRTVL